MPVCTKRISISTNGHCDIINITDQVKECLDSCDLNDGIITVFIGGSTGGISTIEYEPGLIKDLPEMFEKIAPSDKSYHHDQTWHDGNGHAHVRSALMGTSSTFPFSDGRLLLGTWQQIIFVDFDNRSRNREIIVQIMGE